MPEPATLDPKEEQVRGWRFVCFLEAGFTVGQSRRLSEAGADHHEAETLLNAGCPRELVYRLVRPLKL